MTCSARASTVWLLSISVTHSRCCVDATVSLPTKEATVHTPVISPAGARPHKWCIAQTQLFPIKGKKKKSTTVLSLFFSLQRNKVRTITQPRESSWWWVLLEPLKQHTRLLLTLDDQSQWEVEVSLHKAYIKACSISDVATKTHGLEKTLCALWWLVFKMQKAPAFMWASNYKPQLWSPCTGRGAGRKVPCLTFKKQTFSLAFSLQKSGEAKGV